MDLPGEEGVAIEVPETSGADQLGTGMNQEFTTRDLGRGLGLDLLTTIDEFTEVQGGIAVQDGIIEVLDVSIEVLDVNTEVLDVSTEVLSEITGVQTANTEVRKGWITFERRVHLIQEHPAHLWSDGSRRN